MRIALPSRLPLFPCRFARHFAVLISSALSAGAVGQSTAFDYQGDLRVSGQPASGNHDIRFKLFDAPTGGTQIGSTTCVNNVPVIEGKFTTTIDFGQQFVSPAPRYLEITVRQDNGLPCTDNFQYVTLSPRQLITPAPRAAAAGVAYSLAAPDGSPANALVVDNDGKIGIGTATPTHSLHIANPAPTLALQDTDSTIDQVGYVSYRDSGNVERAWVGYGSPGDPDFSIINARAGGDIVLNSLGSGKVGIGTASPQSALEVHGSVRLGSSGQYFAAAGDENLRIVRGSVAPPADCAGAPTTTGAGFTVTNLSCGEIRINFNPPFLAAPVVVASAEWDFNSGSRYATCSDVSATSAAIRVFLNNGNNVRANFKFIAVGPR